MRQFARQHSESTGLGMPVIGRHGLKGPRMGHFR